MQHSRLVQSGIAHHSGEQHETGQEEKKQPLQQHGADIAKTDDVAGKERRKRGAEVEQTEIIKLEPEKDRGAVAQRQEDRYYLAAQQADEEENQGGHEQHSRNSYDEKIHQSRCQAQTCPGKISFEQPPGHGHGDEQNVDQQHGADDAEIFAENQGKGGYRP